MVSMVDRSEMEVGHRGVVMPWECDDMGHLNIRYYVAKYRESLKHRFVFDPLIPPRPYSLADRFLFLREAHVGTRIACSIGFPEGESDAQVALVSGCLWDMTTGVDLALFTTLLSTDADAAIPANDPAIDLSWLGTPAGDEWCTAMGCFPRPVGDSLNAAELATAAVSDANALAVLELSRGSSYRMDTSRVGFVVAELVLAYRGAQQADSDAFSVYSACLGNSRRSLTFRHRIALADAPAEMATVKSVCVFMDRDTRKAVPIPFDL